MNMILTLSIPLIAVVIGALIAAATTKNSVKFKQLLLSFSGSFLLSITLIELIPEVLSVHSNQKTASLFILFGILLQIILESFSKGAEHGHSHGSEAKGIKGRWLLEILNTIFERNLVSHC
jgi:zinc transporter ZupT